MSEHAENAVHSANPERHLRAAMADVLQELKEFVDTRFQMAKVEFHETVQSFRVGVPLALCVVVFAGTGFLMLTLAAVAIVDQAFAGSSFQWFYSFLIVGVLWMVLGAICAFFAYNEFHGQGRFPKRTIEVLKADKLWLQNKAGSH